MNKTKLLLIASLATYGGSAGIIVADDDVPGADPHVSNIEFGVGYVSDDAWKFGQYNGLNEKGPYLIADIDYKKKPGENRYLDIRGTNLGLESRYLRLDAGVQGQQEYFFVYDELPNYQNNTGLTPYQGVGSTTLTLPAGYTDANLNAFLVPVELETKRQRFDFGAAFLTSKSWKFDIKASHQSKEGVQQMGSALLGGTTQIVGNTYGALLPEPIDYQTNEMDAGIHYSGDKAQVSLIYHVSLFENSNEGLVWQNPYDSVAGLSTYGRQGLAPSNQLHQVSLTGGYTLSGKTRLTGNVSVGRSTQNEGLFAYDVNGAGGALPRDSAEAEVWLTKLGLKVASRATRKLRLSGQYRYDGRDNRTQVDNWNYVLLDEPTPVTKVVTNTPLSWKKHLVDLDANYRINSRNSIRGGYKYRNTNREFQEGDIERETAVENILHAKWKYRPTSSVDLALFGEGSNRDGSEYTAQANENPALRKFYMADRQRGMMGGLINVMPTDRLSLGLRAEYTNDDYQNSEIGLTKANQGNATLDLSYLVAENFTTYAYYTYEDIRSEQVGQGTSTGPGVSTTEFWQADIADKINTFGIGTKITDLKKKWDIGADLTYTQSLGAIDLATDDAAYPLSQYPDLKTRLGSLKLWTTYRQNKQMSYKFSYWFEDYKADNWALDGLDPDSLTNFLLMGEETLDYRVHVIGASAIYQF